MPSLLGLLVMLVEDSGLTAAKFGSEIGVNPHRLTWWKWRLASESRSSPSPQHRGPICALTSSRNGCSHRAKSANGGRVDGPRVGRGRTGGVAIYESASAANPSAASASSRSS